jgi:hypothetical protein
MSKLTKLTITIYKHYLHIIDNTHTALRECRATRSNINKYILKKYCDAHATARQRVTKHIPAEANAQNYRSSIA